MIVGGYRLWGDDVFHTWDELGPQMYKPRVQMMIEAKPFKIISKSGEQGGGGMANCLNFRVNYL